MRKVLGILISAFAILLFTGCNYSQQDIVIKKPIIIQKRLIVEKAPQNKDDNNPEIVVNSMEKKNSSNNTDINDDIKACCDNKKKDVVLYKTRYKVVPQCPKQVEVVEQSNECESCSGFEVTVRKNSCCAKDGCDSIKDRR